ncbi:MAG: hypothetical protein GY947_05335 [Rhodobacteraceae bacterium]|nr:hypothetical protein [Paracoccaceae bacterium]
MLTGAFFISVAYYLVLLAAFGLKLLGVHDPIWGKVIATTFIALICGTGALKGLEGVEKAEKFSVNTNLAAIAALLVALVIFGLTLPGEYSWGAAAKQFHTFDWETF